MKVKTTVAERDKPVGQNGFCNVWSKFTLWKTFERIIKQNDVLTLETFGNETQRRLNVALQWEWERKRVTESWTSVFRVWWKSFPKCTLCKSSSRSVILVCASQPQWKHTKADRTQQWVNLLRLISINDSVARDFWHQDGTFRSGFVCPQSFNLEGHEVSNVSEAHPLKYFYTAHTHTAPSVRIDLLGITGGTATRWNQMCFWHNFKMQLKKTKSLLNLLIDIILY